MKNDEIKKLIHECEEQIRIFGRPAAGHSIELLELVKEFITKTPPEPVVQADADKWCGSATCPNNKGYIGNDSLCNCKRTA